MTLQAAGVPGDGGDDERGDRERSARRRRAACSSTSSTPRSDAPRVMRAPWLFSDLDVRVRAPDRSSARTTTTCSSTLLGLSPEEPRRSSRRCSGDVERARTISVGLVARRRRPPDRGPRGGPADRLALGRRPRRRSGRRARGDGPPRPAVGGDRPGAGSARRSCSFLSYPPAVVAKPEVADLDPHNRSHVVLGIGIGGEYPNEFRACQVPVSTAGPPYRRGDHVHPRALDRARRSPTTGASTGREDVRISLPTGEPGGPPNRVAGRQGAGHAPRRAARQRLDAVPLLHAPLRRIGRQDHAGLQPSRRPRSERRSSGTPSSSSTSTPTATPPARSHALTRLTLGPGHGRVIRRPRRGGQAHPTRYGRSSAGLRRRRHAPLRLQPGHRGCRPGERCIDRLFGDVVPALREHAAAAH